MWPVSSLWPYLVGGGSVTPMVTVRSMLGADFLADVSPQSWSESVSCDGRKVSSTLELQVADPKGVLTSGVRAPLGWLGQRLTVRAGFAKPGAFVVTGNDSRQPAEMLPMGSWLITAPGSSPVRWVDYPTMKVRRGGLVSPTAVDLLALLEDDDFTTLMAPLSGGTVRSEVLRIVGDRLPVAATWPGVDGSLAVPASSAYPDNRLQALCDVLAVAGAAAWVNRAGVLQPLPLAKTTVDRALTNAVIVSKVIVGGRDGLFNRAIVKGSAADGSPLIGVASETTGPLSVTSEYGVVAKTFNNPLGQTQAAIDVTAATYLAQGIAARSVRAEIALTTPDYAIDILDRVSATDPDGTLSGLVQSFRRSSSGMTLNVSVPWSQVVIS